MAHIWQSWRKRIVSQLLCLYALQLTQHEKDDSTTSVPVLYKSKTSNCSACSILCSVKMQIMFPRRSINCFIIGQLMRIKVLFTFYNMYLFATILKYLNVQKCRTLYKNMQRVAGVRLGPDSNNNGMEEGEQMLSFNSQSFQLFNVFRSLSLFLLFLCIYQSFLSTYKDIIGKLSIHHIMFFAYGSSKRKWKPFLLLLSLHQQKKEHRRRRKKRKKVSSSLLQF